jgi:hypothetical protein
VKQCTFARPVKRVAIAIAAVAVLSLVLALRRFSSYSISRVDPRIRGLQQPFQTVNTGFYLDGGSVGIEIIDRDGKKIQLATPIWGSESQAELPLCRL